MEKLTKLAGSSLGGTGLGREGIWVHSQRSRRCQGKGGFGFGPGEPQEGMGQLPIPSPELRENS